MKTFILFLFGLLAFTQGRVVEISGFGSRIVNGVPVNPGEIPYQISLQRTGMHFCGGSIVNENWIVTAAHCVRNGLHFGISVIAGTTKLTEPYSSHPAAKVIVHENYKPTDSKDDIALVKVETPFVFSDLVQPVELPEPKGRVKTNSTAVVSGWGGLVNTWSPTPNDLQKAEIYIADPEYCINIMQGQGREIYPTNVCAFDPTIRRGQCNGDSGGPLVVEGKLTGIVSWSIKDPDCASTKYPGVYTRVSEYVDWIAKHVQ